MADETKGEQTERVVLERVSFGDPEEPTEDFAWRERGTATGSKREAIKAVVGDQQGIFRAPSLRSWKGAIEQSAPVVRQRALDE